MNIPPPDPSDADTLPAFGKAEEGSALGELDRWHAARAAEREGHAVARRDTQGRRALALLRGESDPSPTEPSEPEPDTIARTERKNAKAPQEPAEYQRQVAAYKTAQWNELRTGKVQTGTTVFIGYDARLGAFTSRRRRARTSPRAPRRARNSRAGHRRTTAPSRAGPGEPPGESDSDGEGEPSAAAGVCAGCGAELLEPAPLCGLCQLERGETEPPPRTCAICDGDISHRRANAETCSPRCKKTAQRRKVKARGGPLRASSADPSGEGRDRPIRLFFGGEEVRRLTLGEATYALGKVSSLRLCDEHPRPVMHLAPEGCPLCALMLEDLIRGGVESLRWAA